VPSGRKKVTVQYRKLDDIGSRFGGRTLQDALTNSVKSISDGTVFGDVPRARHFDDPNYGTILLNTFHDEPFGFFGELVRFEPGADLPLLEVAPGARAYNLTQARAPDGHEPVRGLLYFMTYRNHMLVIEADMSTSRAERYLSWLLSEATNVLPAPLHVVLAAELSPDAATARLSRVDEVIFRPSPVRSPDPPRTDEFVPVVRTTSREVEESNAFRVLRAAGMDDVDIRTLAQGETELEVTLQIKFRARGRRRPVGIEDANRLLRNVPEDQITLHGNGSRQKEGRIVKLSYAANVECVGSLLKPSDVRRALHEAFKYFVSNGYIDG